jgi:glyoxylase-like metal-dependent hydrolase (beta-lactamase superfamily II)
MPVAGSSPLVSPIAGLLATPASRLPYQRDVLLRSYVLVRPGGNVIVYDSPGVSESAAAILALGTPDRLLVNHEHEAMHGQPDLEVPVWIHEDDRQAVAGRLEIAGTFRGRSMIGDDLEVIPTPGHTAGTTSFLWDDGTHRFLFTGDAVWIEGGEWKAVVLDPALRPAYLDSLATIRDLDFDVLVPWGVTEGDAPVAVVADRAEARDRIDRIIARVAAGGDR